ncbi:mRNA splicing protein prp18 [Sticta canariensis]|nr:mRNA splicing protein prp18 [Sticta canariensis]
MDFAALMSKEISKSRPTPSAEPSKKYVKRADVEAQRQEAYLLEQQALLREREAKLDKKRKADEEESARAQEREEKRRRLAEESRIRREEDEDKKERARRKRLGLPDLPPRQGSLEGSPLPEGQEDLPDEDLFSKLRALNEPVILFGETHKQRLRRYKRLTAPELPGRLAHTSGPIPTTLALVPESSMKVPATVPSDPEGRTFLFRQLASYFTMVLTEWAIALGQRSEVVKESFQGKAAYNAMAQSRENMRPLFKKFEKGELEDGILEPVVEIVRASQERRYVDANDGYLRLSIGKAAWPIGVTMVGIHERSAREKLHESDKGQAHIMSDEVTRKFLQSIKRCLSFAQTRWPPDDQLQLMG